MLSQWSCYRVFRYLVLYNPTDQFVAPRRDCQIERTRGTAKCSGPYLTVIIASAIEGSLLAGACPAIFSLFCSGGGGVDEWGYINSWTICSATCCLRLISPSLFFENGVPHLLNLRRKKMRKNRLPTDSNMYDVWGQNELKQMGFVSLRFATDN